MKERESRRVRAHFCTCLCERGTREGIFITIVSRNEFWALLSYLKFTSMLSSHVNVGYCFSVVPVCINSFIKGPWSQGLCHRCIIPSSAMSPQCPFLNKETLVADRLGPEHSSLLTEMTFNKIKMLQRTQRFAWDSPRCLLRSCSCFSSDAHLTLLPAIEDILEILRSDCFAFPVFASGAELTHCQRFP